VDSCNETIPQIVSGWQGSLGCEGQEDHALYQGMVGDNDHRPARRRIENEHLVLVSNAYHLLSDEIRYRSRRYI